MEPQFLDYHLKESLVRIRVATLVAVSFYGIFGILDYVMVPDKRLLFWAIRYLIVVPFGLWVFFLSFRPGFKTKAHPLLFTMCLLGGLGIECMVILADPPATYSYYAGIILVFITIHTFLNLPFLWASACSWTIVVCYEIVAFGMMDTPAIILINNNFFFISAVLICMLSGYTMELNSRHRFFSTHMLALEKEKVSRINKMLDQRVRERTQELSRANDRLKTEIKEREETQARQIRLEKELNKRQKLEAIGTLAGGIAHDFNNILSAVIGYTELAMEETDPQTLANYHSEVLSAAARAGDLTGQILAFSRQTEQDLSPISLKPIVHEALKMLRASIPAAITMNIRLDSDRRVMADPSQIHRIIVNLGTNALHAMPDQTGTLDILLEEINLDTLLDTNNEELAPGPYLRLSISDTGQGMTPDVMEKIFDPFFTTKPVDQGTGMGLSVVHGIIKQYHGSIRVYSEPGKGTTFTILLPVTQQPADTSEEAWSPIPGGNESILVLDDETTLADMLEKSLSRLGYRVNAFSDAHMALDWVRENTPGPDLIITDYSMPKMNGIEFAKQVNALVRDLPVILCTGYSEALTREKMTSANIRGFMMKPLIRDTTAKIVRQVLDA